MHFRVAALLATPEKARLGWSIRRTNGLTVHLSVRLSVRPSVRPTVRPFIRWSVCNERVGKCRAFPPLPTRPQLLTVYLALFLKVCTIIEMCTLWSRCVPVPFRRQANTVLTSTTSRQHLVIALYYVNSRVIRI